MLAFVTVLATVPPLDLRAAFPRPRLSGEAEQVDEGPFRVHFTRSGPDAPNLEDRDDNGQPDFVDTAIEALLYGEDAFAAEGWRALVGDAGIGEGGSPAIDVYVAQLDGINGYAVPVAADAGTSCFVALDPGVVTAGSVLRSVAVHELHHCVQFRYSTEVPSWLFESASTFEQYTHVKSGLLDVALAVLYADEIGAPATRLASVAPPNDPYTSFLWMKLWTEYDAPDGQMVARLPALWEGMSARGSWRNRLDAASEAAFGLPLDVLFLVYATWNSFACNGDDGAHYDRTVLPCIADVSVPVLAVAVGDTVEIRHVEGPFTAQYLEAPVVRAGTVALQCDGEGVSASLLRLRDGALLQQQFALLPTVVARLHAEPGDVLRAVVVGTEGRLTADCTLWAVPAPPTGCAHGPRGAGLTLLLGGALLAGLRRSRVRVAGRTDRP